MATFGTLTHSRSSDFSELDISMTDNTVAVPRFVPPLFREGAAASVRRSFVRSDQDGVAFAAAADGTEEEKKSEVDAGTGHNENASTLVMAVERSASLATSVTAPASFSLPSFSASRSKNNSSAFVRFQRERGNSFRVTVLLPNNRPLSVEVAPDYTVMMLKAYLAVPSRASIEVQQQELFLRQDNNSEGDAVVLTDDQILSTLNGSFIEVRRVIPRNVRILVDELHLDRTLLLGQGSYGSVYAARRHGEPVAVKELTTQRFASSSEFWQEVGLLVDMPPNPHVCRFFGACFAGDSMLLVMELCQRGSLHSLLMDPKQVLPLPKLLRFCCDAAAGLKWLHASNPPILHRDLKPDNMLLDDHNRVKLIDFGLSSIQLPSVNAANSDAGKGTPVFMAPEALNRETIGQPSDVFSLGVCIWAIFSRKDVRTHVWKNVKTAAMLLKELRKGVRPSIDDLPIAVRKPVRKLLNGCWNIRPTMRPLSSVIPDLLQKKWAEIQLPGDHHRTTCKWIRETFTQFEWLPKIDILAKLRVACDYSNELNCSSEMNTQALTILFDAMIEDGDASPAESWHRNAIAHGLQLFGPLDEHFMDRIMQVSLAPWYHGYKSMDKASAAEVLAICYHRMQHKLTYLVRISTSERGAFVISRLVLESNGRLAKRHCVIWPRVNNAGSLLFSVKPDSEPQKLEDLVQPEAVAYEHLNVRQRLPSACNSSGGYDHS